MPTYSFRNNDTGEEWDEFFSISGKEEFLEAGGEEYTYVPCLNDDDNWAELLSSLTKDYLKLNDKKFFIHLLESLTDVSNGTNADSVPHWRSNYKIAVSQHIVQTHTKT